MEQQSWTRVAALEDVPPGTLKAVRVGREYFAVANLDGAVYALENECPHRGGPLAGGKLVRGQVACPWHGFRFDPRDGSAVMPSEHPPAQCIPARVVDGSIELDLSSRDGAAPGPLEPEVGQVYEVAIESQFESQWTGVLGIGRLGDYDVQVPKAVPGERYQVKVTALGKNQWTGRNQATVEVIPA
jgi:3-phenylpropionate/trans-cinnamate dioxygenase ferredoxin subunit